MMRIAYITYKHIMVVYTIRYIMYVYNSFWPALRSRGTGRRGRKQVAVLEGAEGVPRKRGVVSKQEPEPSAAQPSLASGLQPQASGQA